MWLVYVSLAMLLAAVCLGFAIWRNADPNNVWAKTLVILTPEDLSYLEKRLSPEEMAFFRERVARLTWRDFAFTTVRDILSTYEKPIQPVRGF